MPVITRTEAAWLLSARKLFAEHPKIYFWTFTFTTVLSDWQYPKRWHGFMRDLVWNIYGGRLSGLRVLEVHKEHGLHYHALLNRRLWIRLALKYGKRYGIGRITVHRKPVDIGTAHYLAKYLDKDRFTTATKISRWHSVGTFKAIRKNDIEVLSPFNSTVKEFQEAHKHKRLTPAEFQRLRLEHFDLLPSFSKAPSLTHPRSGICTPDPDLDSRQLDQLWNPEPCPIDLKTILDAETFAYENGITPAAILR